MNNHTKVIQAMFIGALLFNTYAHARNVDIYYTKMVDVSGGMQNLVIFPKEYSRAHIGENIIVDKDKHYSVGLQQDALKPNQLYAQGHVPFTLYVQLDNEKRKIKSFGPTNPEGTLLFVYSNDDNLTVFQLDSTFKSPDGKSIYASSGLYLYNKLTKSVADYQMTWSDIVPPQTKNGQRVDAADGERFDEANLDKISYDTDKRRYLIQLKIDRNNKQWATARGVPVKPQTVNSDFYLKLDKSANGMKCVPVPKSIVNCIEDGLTIPIQPTELVK